MEIATNLPVNIDRNKIALLLCGIMLFLSAAQVDGQGLEGELNLNSATIEQLQKLPFIGETRARAIIDYRRTHGNFTTLADLLNSQTIGQSTFQAIKPYLTLSGQSSLISSEKATPGHIRITTQKVHRHISTTPGDVRILADQEYFNTLIDFIKNARQEINMAMFIFRTTKSVKNKPAQIMNELIRAARRGVRVRVLLENSDHFEDLSNDNRRVAKKLKQNRIAVDFDSPGRTKHTKLVIIDRRYSFVGSHNFTHSAMTRNHELSLLLDSRSLALELLAYIANIPVVE